MLWNETHLRGRHSAIVTSSLHEKSLGFLLNNREVALSISSSPNSALSSHPFASSCVFASVIVAIRSENKTGVFLHSSMIGATIRSTVILRNR